MVSFFSNIIDGKGVSRDQLYLYSVIVITKTVNSMLCFVKLIVGYLPVT